MKRVIYFIVLLSILYPVSAKAQWTVIKNEDFLPFDSSKGNYERLEVRDLAIFNDKVAMSRFNNMDGKELAIFENNKWKLFYIDDIKKLFVDENVFKDLDFSWGIGTIDYDSKGNLWGSSRFGIFKFDGEKMASYNIVYDDKNKDTFKMDGISYIKIDNYDNPWIIVQKDSYVGVYNVCRFINDRFVVVNSFKPFNPTGELYCSRDLAVDKMNRIWQLDVDTLLVFNSYWYYKKFCLTELFESTGARLTKVRISNKNNVYIFTSEFELYVYDGLTWKYDDFVKQNCGLHFPEGYDYTYMCVDSSDNLWLNLRYRDTLYKRSSDGAWKSIYITPFINGNSWYVEGDGIECDRQGKIWLPVQNYGLYIYDPIETKVSEKDINADNEFNISPNPASDYLIIKGNELQQIDIYSVEGIKVKIILAGNSNKQIDISGLSRGVYFLKAGNNVRKFIKI